jgi:hypothetical protein
MLFADTHCYLKKKDMVQPQREPRSTSISPSFCYRKLLELFLFTREDTNLLCSTELQHILQKERQLTNRRDHKTKEKGAKARKEYYIVGSYKNFVNKKNARGLERKLSDKKEEER